eukprot:498800-Lingulodinium_polyedra.AAC.1
MAQRLCDSSVPWSCALPQIEWHVERRVAEAMEMAQQAPSVWKATFAGATFRFVEQRHWQFERLLD